MEKGMYNIKSVQYRYRYINICKKNRHHLSIARKQTICHMRVMKAQIRLRKFAQSNLGLHFPLHWSMDTVEWESHDQTVKICMRILVFVIRIWHKIPFLVAGLIIYSTKSVQCTNCREKKSTKSLNVFLNGCTYNVATDPRETIVKTRSCLTSCSIASPVFQIVLPSIALNLYNVQTAEKKIYKITERIFKCVYLQYRHWPKRNNFWRQLLALLVLPPRYLKLCFRLFLFFFFFFFFFEKIRS